MKTTFRIPMKDPYAYIELQAEEEAFEPAYEKYLAIMKVVNGEPAGAGLDPKKWNAFLDEYLKTGTVVNGGDVYGDMSAEQQRVINEIKKSRARNK